MQWSSKECLLPLYTKLLTGEGQRKTVEIKNGNASYLLIQISTKYRMECTKQHYLFKKIFLCDCKASHSIIMFLISLVAKQA